MQKRAAEGLFEVSVRKRQHCLPIMNGLTELSICGSSSQFMGFEDSPQDPAMAGSEEIVENLFKMPEHSIEMLNLLAFFAPDSIRDEVFQDTMFSHRWVLFGTRLRESNINHTQLSRYQTAPTTS